MTPRPVLFLLIVILQALCALVFVGDIVLSVLGVPVPPIPWQINELIEIGAAFGLLSGLALGTLVLRSAMQQSRRAEEALRIASGAFGDLVEERFGQWGLTPAERDVAMFTLKGSTLAEIAQMRNTSEGTVKAQSGAIYRKAGVSSRTQLLSLFVEDLIMNEGN